MMFSLTPMVVQLDVPSLDSNQDPGPRRGADRRVDNPHLVIRQTDGLQIRIESHQRGTERSIERVDRAVSLGNRVGPFAADMNLDRRFTDRRLSFRAHRHVVRVDVKRRRLLFERPPDQQRQRPVGRLELVALVLERLDALEHLAELGRVLRHVEPELPRLHDDVAAAGELADQDLAAVADERGIDVLVAAEQLLDGVHVRPALVRERGGAHPRQARVRPDVGDLVDELGQLLEERQRFGRHGALHQLERQIRNDRRQVAVAGPLAVPVDRALHVRGTGVDGGERVRDAKTDVVVRVDADPDRQPRPRRARRSPRSRRESTHRWCRTGRRCPRPPRSAARHVASA